MKKALLIFIGLGVLSFACAQQSHLAVIAPAGSTDQTNGVAVEWTLGELAIRSLETGDGFMTQGFHQPFLTLSSMQVPHSIFPAKVFMSVRPNPVAARLYVGIQSEIEGSAILTLTNMEGLLLKKEPVDLRRVDLEWDMSSYPPGMYLLSLHGKNGVLISSFKVVKNH